jgi:Zn finger protein HypA/HybF involved in hydrogenase expression
MQKVIFKCEQCEVEGSIRLPSKYDDYNVEVCPCCGSNLELDDEYDEADE